MIQRIQSLYLLAALLLGALIFNLSIHIDFDASQTQVYKVNYGFLIAPLAVLLCFFLYKKRSIQSLLCLIIVLQQLVQMGLLALSFDLNDNSIMNELLMLLTLVTIVLVWLARRGIQKDEALVRSVDRIR